MLPSNYRMRKGALPVAELFWTAEPAVMAKGEKKKKTHEGKDYSSRTAFTYYLGYVAIRR